MSGSLAIIAACHGGDGSSPTSNGPTANAGPDVSVDEKSVVQLLGGGSSNTDPVTFAWTQVSGQTVVLSNTAIANPTFAMPTVPIGVTADIELRLTVTDSAGAMASDTIRITGLSSDYVVYIGEEVAAPLTGLFAFDAETGVQTRARRTVLDASRRWLFCRSERIARALPTLSAHDLSNTPAANHRRDGTL